jgi:proteic killer suppression protein
MRLARTTRSRAGEAAKRGVEGTCAEKFLSWFIAYRYMINIMIRSFRDAETEKIFRQRFSKKFQSIAKQALRKLIHIDVTDSLNDLAVIPGDRLKALEGNRKGQYSVRINDQYRICFEWKDADAYNVEIVDYH